jgi:hypothetical protein
VGRYMLMLYYTMILTVGLYMLMLYYTMYNINI